LDTQLLLREAHERRWIVDVQALREVRYNWVCQEHTSTDAEQHSLYGTPHRHRALALREEQREQLMDVIDVAKTLMRGGRTLQSDLD
jgi:hypothetical protein